jgi:hypothetical protein
VTETAPPELSVVFRFDRCPTLGEGSAEQTGSGRGFRRATLVHLRTTVLGHLQIRRSAQRIGGVDGGVQYT